MLRKGWGCEGRLRTAVGGVAERQRRVLTRDEGDFLRCGLFESGWRSDRKVGNGKGGKDASSAALSPFPVTLACRSFFARASTELTL